MVDDDVSMIYFCFLCCLILALAERQLYSNSWRFRIGNFRIQYKPDQTEESSERFKNPRKLLYKFPFLPSEVFTFAFSAFCSSCRIPSTAKSTDFHVKPCFLSYCFLNWIKYWHLLNLKFEYDFDDYLSNILFV